MNEIKHYWMKQFTNPSHFLIFIYSIICLSSIPACSGLIYLNDGTVIEDGSLFDMINTISLAQLGNFSGIQFFYSSSCGSCKDAHRFLQSYERKHPEVHNIKILYITEKIKSYLMSIRITSTIRRSLIRSYLLEISEFQGVVILFTIWMKL